MSVNVIALDVGGTSVKSALVVDGVVRGDIIHTRIDSQADADVILGTLAAIVNGHLAEAGAVDGVALGVPGPFEYATGVSRILGVEKFESIYGCDVGESLRGRLNAPDLPIRFRNDAEAAIVGEARFGAGRGFHRLIGLTRCPVAKSRNGYFHLHGFEVCDGGWPGEDVFPWYCRPPFDVGDGGVRGRGVR
jgi:glucokinase